MQVICVKAFGRLVPGDEAEVPDGSAVDPEHFVPAPAPPPPPRPPVPAAAIPSAVAVTPKEM
jgi:hypothetical protein